MRKTLKRMILLLLVSVIAATAPLAATALPEPVAKDEPTPDIAVASPSRLAQPESANTGMEAALITAKSLIDIDDDVFTDFSYGSSYSNYETMEGLLWNFNWSSTDVDGGGYIYATVTADGTLINFWKYIWGEEGFGFADISKNGAIAIADGFIKKASPDSFVYYKAPDDVRIDINSSDYSITYYANVNGYHFETAQISINIDKYTGEVVGYSTNRIDPGNYKFEDSTGIITESAAVTAYADKIGLNLEYRSYFEYDSGNLKVFPVYTLSSYNDKYISAKTGDVVEYVYDAGIADEVRGLNASAAPAPGMAEDAGNGGSRASLSPAEMTAIEQAAGFITSEQALQKLLEAAELTDLDIASFNDQYIGLNRDWISKSRYFYDINMYKYTDYDAADEEITSVYGRVDAVSGRVTSFNFYYNGYPMENQKTMTEAQIEQAVAAFLKKMAPSELGKVKLDESRSIIAVPYKFGGGSHDFNYIRYENDIPFRDNGINVTLNEYTGKITGYSLNWYDDISFPGISNALAPARALSEYVAQNGSKIKYITIGEGNAALVYDFRSGEYIDPFTGKALDYTGKLWTDSTVTPDYSDIKGHWSEKYVTKLLDNGVFLWGGKFEPEKVMTELEFLQYLMLMDPYSYYARADAQAYFAQRGVKVEASPDKLLTRQEAVRIIVEYLGYGKLAKQSEWFVYPFKDNVAEEYKGYITICYMLGVINGNDGRFNAANNVTRAHASAMLYNLILAKS